MGDQAGNQLQTEALVVEKAGAPFVLQIVALDDIRPHELLVDIKYAGLCHTDLVVQAGHMPFGSFPTVLGHEGAGVIRSLGSGIENKDLRVGDRVILGFCSCLDCPACKDNRKGACESIAPVNFVGSRGEDSASTLHTSDGAPVRGSFFGQSSFSRLAVVDSRAVVKYSGPVDDLEYLAPLGCGYMTGAATVMNVLKPNKSHSIAILGLGAVGLCALMAAKREGIETIVALDIVESRLVLAKQFGATHAINSKGFDSVEEAIREILPRGVNFVVDTTGSTTVIDSGVRALAHGGTLAIVGTPRPQETLNTEALDMLTQCKSIIGVTGGFCNPQEFIPRLLEMFKSGEFPIDKLHKTYRPADIETAIDDMKSGRVVKPVIAW
ncbi:chaperonin 10-like protein [Coniochaeta sp. 2T2.1]|nr:chaperonin 10-like protein [Coniochaeta sp. 2T2.1]